LVHGGSGPVKPILLRSCWSGKNAHIAWLSSFSCFVFLVISRISMGLLAILFYPINVAIDLA
jgi:hypothetical protein